MDEEDCIPSTSITEMLPSCSEGPHSNETRSRVGCFVPCCTNSSINSSKIFLNVPLNLKTRMHWFDMANRPYNVSDKCTMYACEDHFKLQAF